jgi:PAS domain S-box-containing protein
LQQTGHWEGELEHTTRDGRRVIVECRKTAIRTDTGQILILESNRDVTERRKAELSAARLHGELEKYASDLKQTNKTLEESRHAALNLMEDSVIERARAEQINAELRESQERLKRAQEIAHLGSWELDLVKNRLTWSDELYRILGLKPQAVQASREAFLARVHPDDRAAVDAAYSSSLRENRDTYESEHRIVREDTGEIRMVYERSQHFHDANGRIFRSIGMVHDITERKLAEQALARTAKELGRSNKDLEQFAHVTSHDLKEPLRMVTGFMSLLKERYSGKLDAKAGEYIDFAADAAGRMQKMVVDRLGYGRAGRDDVVEMRRCETCGSASRSPAR